VRVSRLLGRHGCLLRRRRTDHGPCADSYHRIDIRPSLAQLVVRHHAALLPIASGDSLYESGFARVGTLHVRRRRICADLRGTSDFCPYKGLCSYYDIVTLVWPYVIPAEAYPEVGRISGLVSFEPDIVSVQLDGTHST